MIKHVEGDIFESGAQVILHHVNCQGVMGSGVAKQVREKYPVVFEYYKSWCDDLSLKPGLLGQIQTVYTDDAGKQAIVNLFAQDKFGYDGNCYTSYEALKKCLESVNKQFAGHTVAIPYLMACHRGGGDWSVVSKMIEDTLTDCDVTLYEYCGG